MSSFTSTPLPAHERLVGGDQAQNLGEHGREITELNQLPHRSAGRSALSSTPLRSVFQWPKLSRRTPGSPMTTRSPAIGRVIWQIGTRTGSASFPSGDLRSRGSSHETWGSVHLSGEEGCPQVVGAGHGGCVMGSRYSRKAVSDSGSKVPSKPVTQAQAQQGSNLARNRLRRGVSLMAALWTIQARHHLRQELAEALCRENENATAAAATGKQTALAYCTSVLELTMDRLNDILAGTFEGASVVIQDHVLGYRRKKDLFVLMVEVFGSDDSEKSGPFVVKIGSEARLRREIRGWDCCRPPGLKHDLVFLGLRVGATLDVEGERWMSLVYGNAQQFLCVTVTLTFEEAVLA